MQFLSKPVTIILIVLLLIGGGFAAYALNKRNQSNDTDTAPKAGKQTQSQTQESQNQPGVQVTTDQDDTKTIPPTSNVSLETPYGSFVSNHKPSLSAANTVNSVCHTTLSATCEIRFSKGSEVKVLGPDKVGATGYVSWNWKLQDIGLSAGTWQVEAVAKLSGKTATATDTIALEISQ